MDDLNIAFVHEWLTSFVGSEKVLEAVLELFPGAPVYALVYDAERLQHTRFAQHPVYTSFIQRLPGAVKKYQRYLPLMPLAVEQFDLSGYDLIFSSSHAVAKGVLARANQLHISYVHTPIRYAWDLYFQYLREANLTRGIKSLLARLILHYVRLWDATTASRVDVFVANSRYVARRIWRTYRRRAHVIYPPVEVNRFNPGRPREDFYLTLSRFVPYKRVDLIVSAFTRMKRPLVVIGDGPDFEKIKRLAGPNVQLMGYQPDEVVRDHMERCKAFVFAAEEDFGITPVEAQAAGAPVIAYGRGGVTETVVAGKTGLFFQKQSEESLIEAVDAFERDSHSFDPEIIRRHAERFSRERFQREISALIEQAWKKFVQKRGLHVRT